jgi:aromatic ring-opening dioxygenase LigB subunit
MVKKFKIIGKAYAEARPGFFNEPCAVIKFSPQIVLDDHIDVGVSSKTGSRCYEARAANEKGDYECTLHRFDKIFHGQFSFQSAFILSNVAYFEQRIKVILLPP